MNRSFIPLTIATTLLTQSSFAGTVVADFNDINPGPIGDLAEGAGQSGGFGWLNTDFWGNSDAVLVIADDLVAPATTGYAVTQNGTGQSIQSASTGGQQATREVEAPLTGTVWISFLLNQPTVDSRGGVTFNRDSATPSNPRIVATGTEVRLGLGGVLQGAGTGANLLTPGQTALILGRLTIDENGGPESLDVWIDPDLSGGAEGLPAPDTSLTEDDATMDGGITRVGLQSYSADGQGGIVDSVRLSDEDNGFTVVTSNVELISDDPNLVVSILNPFEDISLRSADSPVTSDITITNDGQTNTLTVADSTTITGEGSASFSIITPLPLEISPGATAILQVQLDPAGDARISTASLDLVSNDAGSPTISIPLSARIIGADGNQLLNSDFESDPTLPVLWTATNVDITEGIAPGSTSSAALAPDAALIQTVTADADWFFESFFQAPDTSDRAFNLLVDAPGGNINLRFQGTSTDGDQTWNLFDLGAWSDALALPAVQPGATYLIRITGKNWDGIAPTFNIELSEPNGTSFAATVEDLAHFQNGIPTGPPTQIRFSTQFGGAPGFIVDDTRFANGTPLPSAGPVVTNVSYSNVAKTITLTFEAQVGVSYSLFASDDLKNWVKVGERIANSPSEIISEIGLTSSKHFYYISVTQ